jgi:hypothetical protein
MGLCVTNIVCLVVRRGRKIDNIGVQVGVARRRGFQRPGPPPVRVVCDQRRRRPNGRFLVLDGVAASVVSNELLEVSPDRPYVLIAFKKRVLDAYLVFRSVHDSYVTARMALNRLHAERVQVNTNDKRHTSLTHARTAVASC